MRKLDYDSLAYVNAGGYGRYYRLKNTDLGVKLGLTAFRAKLELKTLRRAYRRTKMVPKPYHLVRVRQPGKQWEYGYTMSHIDGTRYCGRDEVIERIDRTFRRRGIHHYDLHMGNILVRKTRKTTRFYLIDFDPRFVKVKV